MDKKISQLTAASTPLTGTEEIAIVQSGVTKKATIEDVKGYKVYTGLLTQSGGDVIGSANGLQNLTKGVTYTIQATEGADYTLYGAPNNELGTKFVCNQNVLGGWGSEDNSLVYNTGAPVVTVLENTIGNVWFTYDVLGTYVANSSSLFTYGKSTIFLGETYWEENPGVFTSGFDGDSISYIKSFNSSFAPANNILLNTFLEIRVYP